MYSNIGGKIKGLAIAIFIIEAIISVFSAFGMAIFAMGEGELGVFLLSFLVLILGPIIAWVSSWLLYGFGELIAKTCDIANNTRGEVKKSIAQTKVDLSRIEVLENLRAQGLISEAEYQQAIAKY